MAEEQRLPRRIAFSSPERVRNEGTGKERILGGIKK